jgi:hypothetical protein
MYYIVGRVIDVTITPGANPLMLGIYIVYRERERERERAAVRGAPIPRFFVGLRGRGTIFRVPTSEVGCFLASLPRNLSEVGTQHASPSRT